MCEVEVMDKIAEDIEDAARWHNSEILFPAYMLINQEGIVNLKISQLKTGIINDKERVKERWEEHFPNVLNRNIIARKDIENN